MRNITLLFNAFPKIYLHTHSKCVLTNIKKKKSLSGVVPVIFIYLFIFHLFFLLRSFIHFYLDPLGHTVFIHLTQLRVTHTSHGVIELCGSVLIKLHCKMNSAVRKSRKTSGY